MPCHTDILQDDRGQIGLLPCAGVPFRIQGDPQRSELLGEAEGAQVFRRNVVDGLQRVLDGFLKEDKKKWRLVKFIETKTNT